MTGASPGKPSRIVLAILLLAAGCAKTTHGDGETAGEGGAGGSDGGPVELPPEPTCVAGSECRCESGLVGETRCEGSLLCDCSACPPYSPDNGRRFEVCGGPVEGSWSTRTYDLSGLRTSYSLPPSADTAPTSCPTDLTELAPPDLRLIFHADGSAEATYTAPKLFGTVLESCLQAGLGRGCEQIPGCTNTGCGTCGCQLDGADFASASASFSTDETVLKLGPWAFDYCVRDRIMMLRNRDDGLQLELELE